MPGKASLWRRSPLFLDYSGFAAIAILLLVVRYSKEVFCPTFLVVHCGELLLPKGLCCDDGVEIFFVILGKKTIPDADGFTLATSRRSRSKKQYVIGPNFITRRASKAVKQSSIQHYQGTHLQKLTAKLKSSKFDLKS
ncbi:hypothetical protein ACH5RR_008819 [Cinchona calisaya]|uniref:Uncharacterized protein n=1 Tax=Cinchona calisaya TaxID=153742 RepID=A0ABD3ACP6_9GENT